MARSSSTSARSARSWRSTTAGSRKQSTSPTVRINGVRAAGASLAVRPEAPTAGRSRRVGADSASPVGPEQQMVEAADSSTRATTAGRSAHREEPGRATREHRAALRGQRRADRDVAWDISWYQYRVSPESAQPVRLAERGHEMAELDAGYQRWNARIEQDGRSFLKSRLLTHLWRRPASLLQSECDLLRDPARA